MNTRKSGCGCGGGNSGSSDYSPSPAVQGRLDDAMNAALSDVPGEFADGSTESRTLAQVKVRLPDDDSIDCA